MPFYDTICPQCADVRTNVWLKGGEHPVCLCGATTEYLWTTPPNVIPDTYSTPIVDDHLASGKVYVHESRSQHRDRMRAHGMENLGRHIGLHTDKGRWH